MRRTPPPRLEVLEDRTVPASFGVPWSDPSHLTLSFVPDGTPIAGHTNTLFQTLNAVAPTVQWESEILQAVQTWTSHVNVSVGVVPDGGQPLGTPGPQQGDPRFGDIRIAAQSMSGDALSVSVPHDPFLSGTWAGDVFLNDQYQFDGAGTDLYSVLLHEFGHVLGLGDSTDPASVMYPTLNYTKVTLAPSDIANIRTLYGRRVDDSHKGNNSLATAAALAYPTDQGAYAGATPLVGFADISQNGQKDYFSVQTLPGYQGAMTFRLQTAGISLIGPLLTVYDAAGNVLGRASSANLGGDSVTVHLTGVLPDSVYYIRVAAARSKDFGAGRYGLAVTFDDNLTVPADTIDAVLRGPYDKLTTDEIDAVFIQPANVFLHNDHHGNDIFADASELETEGGYSPRARFTAIGSISDPTDVDFYRLGTPKNGPDPTTVMTVAVSGLDVNGTVPRVELFDRLHHPVPVNVLTNGNGTFSFQAAGLPLGTAFFLKVFANADSPAPLGNYSLQVWFNQPADLVNGFVAGTLQPTATQGTGNLYVAESQLFHFVLSADSRGVPTDAAVNLTIAAGNGNVVESLTARPGDAVSGSAVFLAPGAYTVQATAVTPSGSLDTPLDFALQGAVLSDAIGPVIQDATLAPLYISPSNPNLFTYPNGQSTTVPYWIGLIF